MNDEQERLKRLRERQISARDPMVKIRKGQQRSAERERKRDKSVSLLQAWSDIPRFWRSLFWSLLLTGVATSVLSSFFDTFLSIVGGLGIGLVFLLFAIIIGNALNERDELRRLSK